MGLIGKWSAIVAGCEQAAAELGYEGYAVAADARAQAFSECIGDLRSACTPRKPQPEWFGAPVDTDGKPTGKWDAWAVKNHIGVWRIVRQVERNLCGCQKCDRETPGRSPLDGVIRSTDMVVPVRREGPPAMDVGWDVVGG